MSTNYGYEESQEIPEVVLKQDKSPPQTTLPVENEKVYTFDEAVALTKTGKFHYFLQVVSGICLMTAVIEIMGMSIVIPFISRDIPSTTAEKGLLASAGYIGVVTSSHAVGFLSDTWGRSKMMRTTLSLSFITSFASAFSLNIWMFIVLRFLTGFIMSASQGSVFNFLGEFHSSKTRAKYVTMLSMFSQMAMIIMPAAAMFILPLKLNTSILGLQFESWRLLLLVYTLMRTFALIGLFILPETPKFVLVHGDQNEVINTLQMMYSINTGNSRCEYPVHKIVSETKGDTLKNVHGVRGAVELIWSQTVPLFNKSRILHTLNFSLTLFLLSGVSHGAYMWFPTILKQQIANPIHGLSTCDVMEIAYNKSSSIQTSKIDEVSSDVVIDTDMFKILITVGAVFSVTFFIFSLIINAVGKRKLLFILILIPGISSLILQFMTSTAWAVVAMTVLMSLTNCVGIVGTMAFEFFPTNVSGMGMCLIMMIARLGSATGSAVFGMMIYVNCDMLFYISFVLCMLTLVLTLLLPGRKNKKTPK